MNFKIIVKSIIALFIISLGKSSAQQESSNIEITLTGQITGSYNINHLEQARIQNPNLPENSTIGIFTDPSSKDFPFDIALILGNLGKETLETGNYAVVLVENDIPQLKIGQKGGFMTIVPTKQSPPKIEYYTSSGNFIITEIIESKSITGTFSLLLKSVDGDKIINAEGKFRVNINK
ncbi:MAG: hypothetical protein RO257_06700 [Candidatus Kapabacteria bacterium]|nr:hypothetical protein [Candidatus Kapabacteria bacterium]